MEVSIIGGGITGLTTALALQKVGIESTVYEQAQTLNEIGAGVWLQPNAVQVLQWLGIEKEIKAAGCVLNKMEITYPDLTPIKKIKNSIVADRYGNQTIAIHRGKLQSILYEKLTQAGTIELGMPYSSHSAEGKRINIQFGNEKYASTDLLLGADGIKSKVRESIGLPSEYKYTNQICCRGIADFELPDQFKKEGKEVWGNKLRFGFSQLSSKSVYFFVVINKEICPKELTIESIASLFKDFHPLVHDLLKATKNLHTTELTDLKRLETWHSSNTCLLGDAAHATTPNMGQGACQGIEDAYYISHILKNHLDNPTNAFAQFEKTRRKKVDYVVNNSWRFGKMAHNPTGQALLRGIMKLTPEKVMNQQMNKLYEIHRF